MSDADIPVSGQVPFARLLATVGGDEETLRDIAATFVEEGAQLALDLRYAAFQHDLGFVARICHTIKGNARDFEDEALARQAADLEILARMPSAAAVEQRFAEVETALELLISRVKAFLAKEN